MAKVFTTEITSEQITSDNPIHQRLYKAYVAVKDFIHGDVLEVGCGEGRGIALLMHGAATFTAVDKIKPVIDELKKKTPRWNFCKHEHSSSFRPEGQCLRCCYQLPGY